MTGQQQLLAVGDVLCKLWCRDEVAQAQTELLHVSQEVGNTKQQADKQSQLQQDMRLLDKHSAELHAEVQQLHGSLQGLDANKRQLIS